MIPETITYKEAVVRYKCDRKAITKAIKSGLIDAYKPGRVVQIDRKQADDWYLSTKLQPSLRIGRPRRRNKR